MVEIVLAINISLALSCLGLAVCLLRLRNSLHRIDDALVLAEKKTHRVLSRAPYYILLGKGGTARFRQQMTGLRLVQAQIDRWAAVLSLLRLVGMHQGKISVLAGRKNRKSGFKR
jgi:hypothetical protein